MAAPYERAFDEHGRLAEEAAKYTSESAPQGMKEGGEVMAIHYREEEAIYIKASHDRVTVIFSTIFRDETDRVFGKVFLQVRHSQHKNSVEMLTRMVRNSLMLDGAQSKMHHRFYSATSHR